MSTVAYHGRHLTDPAVEYLLTINSTGQARLASRRTKAQPWRRVVDLRPADDFTPEVQEPPC